MADKKEAVLRAVIIATSLTLKFDLYKPYTGIFVDLEDH